MLKIVTYNVNGIRQRISQYGSLLKLLDSLDADIICFQELKVTRQELTADLIMAEGYESFFSCTRTSGKGRTGYSGVATFCRVKSAFSSVEVALPVAAEEGFTGLLETSNGSESRSGNQFSEMECVMELPKDELMKIDSEGRCVITDHGHFDALSEVAILVKLQFFLMCTGLERILKMPRGSNSKLTSSR